jgi:hypothetical protein
MIQICRFSNIYKVIDISNSMDLSDKKNKNFLVSVYQKYFTVSLLEIIGLVEKKSTQTDISSLDLSVKSEAKLHRGHTRLRDCCLSIRNGFTSETDSGYDQGRIIKKIYKTLTQNLDMLDPVPLIQLFYLKNESGETVTIIPGLDIGLVAESFTDEEKDVLWNHLYMMYISSITMISANNTYAQDERLTNIMPKLKEKIVRSGLTIGKDKGLFNPFIGLNKIEEDGEYDLNHMYTNVGASPMPDMGAGLSAGMTMEDIFKLVGVDKMIDIDQLNDQLKNCKQEDVDDATNNITKLLGAENDSDVKDVCQTLVSEIVSDLRTNGLTNMFDTAKSVTSKIGKSLDQNKMKKTANQLQEFMANGEEKLKSMTNEKGENIGQQIFDKLKLPMQFAKMFGAGKQ